MHIVLDNTDPDKIAQIWMRFRRGEINYEQLQSEQDTAFVEAGDVCDECRARPFKVQAFRKRLCTPCFVRLKRQNS